MAAGRVQSPGVVAPTNPPPPSNPYEPTPAVAQSSAVSPDYAKVDTGFGPKYAEPVARGIVNAATTIPFTDIGRLGDKVYGPRKPWQSAGAEFAGEFVGAAGPYGLASKGVQAVASGVKGIRGLYTATKLAEDATTAQKAAHLGIETTKAAGRGALFGGVGEGLGQAADAAGRAYSGREGQVDYTEPLKQAGFFAGIDAALTLLPPALRGLGGAIRGHLKAGNVAAAEELASKIPDSEAAQKIKALFSNWNMENRRIPRVGDAPEPMMPNVSRETLKPTVSVESGAGLKPPSPVSPAKQEYVKKEIDVYRGGPPKESGHSWYTEDAVEAAKYGPVEHYKLTVENPTNRSGGFYPDELKGQGFDAVRIESPMSKEGNYGGMKPQWIPLDKSKLKKVTTEATAPVSPAKQPTVKEPLDMVGDEYVYHNSAPRHLESIRDEGLSLKYAGEYPHGDKYREMGIPDEKLRIYFGESPSKIKDFGGSALLRVKKEAIKDNAMSVEMGLRGKETWYFGDRVAPENIEIKTANGWEPLVRGTTKKPKSPVSPAKQPTVSQTWYAGHGEGKPTGKYLYVTDSPEYAKQFGEVKPYEVSPENTADFSYLGERSVSRERAIAELKKKGVEAQIPLDDDVYKPMWQWVRKYPQIADQVKSSGFDSMAFKETFGGTGKRHNSLMILDESKFGEPPVSPSKQPKRGPSDVVAQSAVGGALGFQEKKDEQGNVIGYEYDPVKGLIGMTGGMAIGMAVNRRGKAPKVETPPENPTPGDINLNRINLTEPERVAAKVRVNQLKPALEKMKGTKLTNDEVIEAAKEVKMSAEVVARSETLKRSAQILNARKNEAELLRKENVTPSELRNILETVRQVESVKTDLGREMQKLSINVDPELRTARSELLAKLARSNVDLGAIEAKAAEYAKQGKSLDDPRNVMEFYREFIKPKASEILDEYRYINMLSSPNTHIVNTTSNLIQGFILRPGTRLAAGGIDAVGSKLTGSERTYYARQVPSYYKGMLNSLPAAIQGVRDVMTGKALTLRPDLQYLPTNSKWTKWGYPVTRALEASDIFVRTLVEGGEKEALAYKAKRTGKEINPEAIDAEAKQTAAEVVFRGELDPSNATGQGLIKSKVFDAPASMLNRLRQLSPPFKWLVPFVQTPLNIAKQGFEYSPLGFAEFGVKDKTAQLAKASIGSTVFVGAGYIALNNGSTWAVPSGKKAKDEFYAAGMKPYSLKIGDTWVSYSKLGPLAYPIALAAALKYHFKDSPSALSDTYSDKVAAGLAEMAQFFSDQSYVQSIGNIIDATKGATTGEWKGEVSQLIGGTGRQLIPLAALQGWVNGIIDPIYRKSEKDLTPEAILQNMQKNVIGLSTNLEPYKDRKDQLSRRALPVGNAFSPFQVSPVDSTGAAQFDKASKERQSETLIRKLKEAQKENDTTEVKRLNDIRAKAGIPAPEPTKPRLPKLPKVGPISQADIDSIPAHIQVKYEGVKSKSGEKVQMTGPARQVLKDLYAESDLYTKILESLT